MMHVYKLDERDGCLGFTFLFCFFTETWEVRGPWEVDDCPFFVC